MIISEKSNNTINKNLIFFTSQKIPLAKERKNMFPLVNFFTKKSTK